MNHSVYKFTLYTRLDNNDPKALKNKIILEKIKCIALKLISIYFKNNIKSNNTYYTKNKVIDLRLTSNTGKILDDKNVEIFSDKLFKEICNDDIFNNIKLRYSYMITKYKV